jgi:hypothetical protein
MSDMDKGFAVVLAAIAVLGAITLRPPPPTAEQARIDAMDSCHREMSAALAMNVDGGRYNVDELCKAVRNIASGRY